MQYTPRLGRPYFWLRRVSQSRDHITDLPQSFPPHSSHLLIEILPCAKGHLAWAARTRSRRSSEGHANGEHVSNHRQMIHSIGCMEVTYLQRSIAVFYSCKRPTSPIRSLDLVLTVQPLLKEYAADNLRHWGTSSSSPKPSQGEVLANLCPHSCLKSGELRESDGCQLLESHG